MTLLDAYPVNPNEDITTVKALRYHLVNAAAIELSTVPLYLYSAYSIKTSGYSQWSPGISAFRTIRSVVIEEMLHLCLARNLLVAIGGDMKLYDVHIVPKFPSDMFHRWPPLKLSLQQATTTQMKEVFMELELPTPKRADEPWLAQKEKLKPMEYGTLGEFYAAIEKGFDYVVRNRKPHEVWGDAKAKRKRSALQYGRAYWNDDGGGQPIIVSDLKTAKLAIKTIVEQGEGANKDTVPLKPAAKDPTPGLVELTHYAKFRQIADGIDGIGAVWPVPDNPKRTNYNGPLGALATLFDAAYCYTLCMLDAIYQTPTITHDKDDAGSTIAKKAIHSPRYHLERTFLAAMGGLLYPLADLLVRQPDPTDPHNLHAAPGFGFYAFKNENMSKKEELIALCEGVLPSYPSLGGDDGVMQLIHRLPSVDPAVLPA
jgi:hypothetical protein